MTFNDSVHKYNLENRQTSNKKIQQVLSSVSLNDIGIYLRDGPFSSDIGIVFLHPLKGTHWVCYLNEKYFDSYGCSPPQKLSNFIKKRNGHCLHYECKLQRLTNKRDFYCARYCLYMLSLTKVVGIDFKSAVLNFLSKIFRILNGIDKNNN